MAGHIVTDHYRFEALPGGKTRVVVKTRCGSVEALDSLLQSGMEGGANESWDRLEELLAG
jgi:hypothetical protein